MTQIAGQASIGRRDHMLRAPRQRDAEPSPFGWFSFRDAELEREFLAHRIAVWTPRVRLVTGVGLLVFGLLSVAALADWDGFLVSSGKPRSGHDAAQTYGPTICLVVINIVIRSPLWTARSFELMLSCSLLAAMLVFSLPAIIELRGQQAGPASSVVADPSERLELRGIGPTCRLGCDQDLAPWVRTQCIQDDEATTFIACSKLMPVATVITLCAAAPAVAHPHARLLVKLPARFVSTRNRRRTLSTAEGGS